MLCLALRKGESYPEIRCGKNGSIHLELVKSLFISENEKDFGYRRRKVEKGRREDRTGRERKERQGEYTPAKQWQELKKVKRRIPQTVEAV